MEEIKIRSHYLQKALIKDVLGKDLLLLDKNGIKEVSLENAFSSRDLFNRSNQDQVAKIEAEMNNKLERRFIELARQISKDENESIISYKDSIIIRLYLFMTMSRLRGRHIDSSKIINNILELDYQARFETTNSDLDLFINKSYIYIIEHKDIKFLLDDAIFMAIPFDQRNNIDAIKMLGHQDPGYFFPISKNKSILMVNTNMLHCINMHIMDKKIPNIRFKWLDARILMNKNAVVDPDGKATDLFGMKKTPSNAELAKRNKSKWKYAYRHKKMIDYDYSLTIIHTLFGMCSLRKHHGAETKIISDSSLLISKDEIHKLSLDIKSLLRLEKYYSRKSKENIDWGKTLAKRYTNSVWSQLTDEVIENLIDIQQSIDEYIKKAKS